MSINIPNIDNINEVNPVYRDGIAAIFKCTRDGWVELLTGARPASEENSPTYEYTPHSSESNLCEMRCTSSDEHVYWDLTDLPKMPQSQPLTAFVFERDLEGSGAARVPFGVSAMPGNAGWLMSNRDSSFPDDTGFTKIAVIGLRFSNLEAANVDTYLCTRLNSDKTVDGYTDEGSQNNSNTSSLNTTSLSRVTIGGYYKSTSTPNFRNGARSKIGPYIIVWDRALSADQITNLAANPSLLKDPTVFNPIQIHNWLYGVAAPPPAVTEIPPALHGLDYQHTVIRASRLGGMLDQ